MRRLFFLFLLANLALLFAVGGVEAAGPPAYLALGDSIAAGIGASDPASGYVARVHRQLLESEGYIERGLELLNLGVPGATSADLLEPGGQLEEALAEIQQRAQDADSGNEVEIITIDIGGNDLRALLREGSPCASDPLGSACLEQAFPQALGQLEANLRQVLRALHQTAPQAALVVITLYNPYASSGSLFETAGEVAVSQFNDVVAEVAAEPEVQASVADVLPLFQQQPSSEVIAPDRIHPTDAGHALIAQAVLAALTEAGVLIPTPTPQAMALPRLGAGGVEGEGAAIPLWLFMALPGGLLGLAGIGAAYRWGPLRAHRR